MSSSQSHDDDPLDSAPAFSSDAVTPRGGFMARPGLKTPPRHAVVVRGGDVPDYEHIPVARSSAPPPPPVKEPVLASADEKITLRAIPTPPSPRADAPSVSLPRVVESVPPPSDAPMVASSYESSSGPASRRGAGARWTIVAAAAAGLSLGLVSVAARLRQPPAGPPTPAAVAQPQSVATPAELADRGTSSSNPVVASASPRPSASVAPAIDPSRERVRLDTRAPRLAVPSAKRSIF
jgi:hypothetical protein